MYSSAVKVKGEQNSICYYSYVYIIVLISDPRILSSLWYVGIKQKQELQLVCIRHAVAIAMALILDCIKPIAVHVPTYNFTNIGLANQASQVESGVYFLS